MNICDTHCHVVSTDFESYPSDPLGGNRSAWSDNHSLTAEQLLAAMDDAGIEQSVVVQAATVYGFDNSYVGDSVDAHPDRLVGICAVNFLADDAVDQLKHWVGERKFVGVRLRAADGATPVPKQGEGLDDPLTKPAWAYVEEHQVPVSIQMHQAQIPQLERLLAEFPRLKVALDHSGRPTLDGGPPYVDAKEYFDLARHKGVFFKITTVALRRFDDADGGPAPVVQALIEHFGADHLMWGSNFPASKGTLGELVTYAEEHFASTTPLEQSLIFSGTARDLYSRLVVK